MKRVLTGVAAVVVVVVAGFFTVGARIADSVMNTVVSTAVPAVSPAGSALHRRLFVADLHADQLLWGRDPLDRSTRGHVDVPRLRYRGMMHGLWHRTRGTTAYKRLRSLAGSWCPAQGVVFANSSSVTGL